jgi:hypothetical protein
MQTRFGPNDLNGGKASVIIHKVGGSLSGMNKSGGRNGFHRLVESKLKLDAVVGTGHSFRRGKKWKLRVLGGKCTRMYVIGVFLCVRFDMSRVYKSGNFSRVIEQFCRDKALSIFTCR